MIAEETLPVRIAGAADTFEDSAEGVLRWALKKFGSKIALITSFQTEGMIIMDMATRMDPNIRIVTIDTGRLHEETYTFMEQVGLHYGVDIEIYFPDSREVGKLVSGHGINLFYRDTASRLECCRVRKVQPLKRILSGLDAWVTGLRKQQSGFRFSTEKIELDRENPHVVKINPLADWTDEEVAAYLKKNDVPRHPLYGRGYTSIGCAPCTRPAEVGELPRAGRWWWEEGVNKECGLHCKV